MCLVQGLALSSSPQLADPGLHSFCSDSARGCPKPEQPQGCGPGLRTILPIFSRPPSLSVAVAAPLSWLFAVHLCPFLPPT